MAQGKDCGAISDGCNMVLDCGTCHPPLRCGAVTPNVCGDERRATMSEPQYIGRYRIVRPLGEGGMGRVLLAEVAGAGGFARRVVLKLVRDELDEALKQSLLDEARVTATLVHRNIVPVLDLHESGAQRLVVLEHIDGMDVRQLLRLTPLLDWPLAAFIGGEVAAALDFAHRRQIIHRDVSPANILVSWEGEVKLSDFGVAKVVGGPGRVMGPTQGLKGKLGYMAPEQMRAQPIDARADVYALGVVLYEMLTGKNPMRAGPMVPPPLPSTVPGELAAIVMRAVERNRDDRFNSAADVREAILHVAGQPADPARQLADFLGELKNQQARRSTTRSWTPCSAANRRRAWPAARRRAEAARRWARRSRRSSSSARASACSPRASCACTRSRRRRAWRPTLLARRRRPSRRRSRRPTR